ncbi:MFS transporter [Paenibacillus beijingensis]|uniref:MFS transporter n=1 Tax=Paenibacillus beijingensis TaxID=1126833 RepID=A0A0D5NKA1_9BACL|nr:MFS transporter [Paenibacillus beijingensis]AJY75358.1 MFS transporter [Paenibacillus beijingensis]
MDITANLWKLYALRFFSSLIPAYVIERLYWEERGMTIQMVVYTEIIYAVTIVLLEVPTGVIADKWGRKRMLVISALLGCGEFIILLAATEFWHFALVVLLAGVSRSAGSGSENALLYDSLIVQGRASSFEKELGRLNVCDFVSSVLAALSGSLLASRLGLELNYWISLGSALIALLISLLLAEPSPNGRNASAEESIPFKRYVAESLLFFRTNPGVRVVLLSGMVTGTALGFIDEFWQLYANRLGTPVLYFGLLSAALMVLRMPGNLLVHVLLNRFSYRTLLITVTAVFAAGFTFAAISKNYAGLAAMLVICFFSGVMEPLAAGYLHHRIDSSMRATIDSFQSLGLNVFHIAAGLGFGYFSVRYDVFGGYGFIALLCAAFLGWLIVASHQTEKETKQRANG